MRIRKSEIRRVALRYNGKYVNNELWQAPAMDPLWHCFRPRSPSDPLGSNPSHPNLIQRPIVKDTPSAAVSKEPLSYLSCKPVVLGVNGRIRFTILKMENCQFSYKICFHKLQFCH